MRGFMWKKSIHISALNDIPPQSLFFFFVSWSQGTYMSKTKGKKTNILSLKGRKLSDEEWMSEKEKLQ